MKSLYSAKAAASEADTSSRLSVKDVEAVALLAERVPLIVTTNETPFKIFEEVLIKILRLLESNVT